MKTLNSTRKILMMILTILILISPHFLTGQNVASVFSVDSTKGCIPLKISFQNNSSQATNFKWIFGDGSYSTEINPVHLYIQTGVYDVSLIACDDSGRCDTLTQYQLIEVMQKPIAGFNVLNPKVCLNEEVEFNNLSTSASSQLWDFGDGETSTDLNPVHQYQFPGKYQVTLLVYNAAACYHVIKKLNAIEVFAPSSALFEVNQEVACDSTQDFSFTALHNSNTQWLWNFGDGTFSSSKNPIKKYAAAGTYSISLITTNDFGCKDTLVKQNLIAISSIKNVDFTPGLTAGCAPLEVKFEALSDDFVNWEWDFGDGTYGSGKSIRHQFDTPSNYTINLTVSDSNGCYSSKQKVDLISVKPLPIVSFEQTSIPHCNNNQVNFLNTGDKGLKYIWSFGDGDSSNLENPVHYYKYGSAWNVTFSVINGYGCKTTTQKNGLISNSGLKADFEAKVETACIPAKVKFTSKSTQAINYLWNFGDGASSTLMNPNHVYTKEGSYTISLFISDNSGCKDTMIREHYVQITNPANTSISNPLVKGCVPFPVEFKVDIPNVSTIAWDFGDGSSSNELTPNHTYTNSGNFHVSVKIILIGGCEINVPNYGLYAVNEAEADFEWELTNLCAPAQVKFTDKSEDAIAWKWNFGDNTFSYLQNPTHVYSTDGVHNVSLEITAANGCTKNVEYSNAIEIPKLSANIDYFTHGGSYPQLFQFYAHSVGATSWLWNFGDGQTSTLENPEHLYTQLGDYNVTLTITSVHGCKKTVGISAIVYAGPDEIGLNTNFIVADSIVLTSCAPKEVHFKNTSEGAVQWLWDFGDSTISYEKNPVHTYNFPGQYSITLISLNLSGVSDTLFKENLIKVGGPTARFDIHKINCNPLTAKFVDRTYVDNFSYIQSRLWDFGDGNVSTLEEPTHKYGKAGNYQVVLTVTDNNDCVANTAISYHTQEQIPFEADKTKSCVPAEITFSTINLNYDNLFWEFGDGQTSTEFRPLHIYEHEGEYSVSVTITDTIGCITKYTQENYVVVKNPRPSFLFTGDSKACAPYTITLSDSSKENTSIFWDFGDSTSAQTFTVSHTYAEAGTYNITMKTTNNFCPDTVEVMRKIEVHKVKADFIHRLMGDCYPLTLRLKNISEGATNFFWNFGNGNSLDESPSMQTIWSHNNQGLSLIASNDYGCSDTLSLDTLYPKFLNIGMEVDAEKGCAPLEVKFTNTTIANYETVFWDFGDGNYSTETNPAHTYHTIGVYNVKLSVKDKTGCKDTLIMNEMITVTKPDIKMSASSNDQCPPSLINFFDQSPSAIAWEWNFGDSKTAKIKNPGHIYTEAGHFDIELTITDSNGCKNTEKIPAMVNIKGPRALLQLSDSIGCGKVQSQIVNNSFEYHAMYLDFGDGASVHSDTALYSWNVPGVYEVTLIVEDTIKGCTDDYTQWVTVKNSPNAKMHIEQECNRTYKFVDLSETSSNAYKTVYWSMGDSLKSEPTSGHHTFPNYATYFVEMEVIDSNGCNAKTQQWVDVKRNLQADFSSKSVCEQQKLTFTNESYSKTNGIRYNSWNFGDGNMSNELNPNHVYEEGGYYKVKLLVGDDRGCFDSLIQEIEIYKKPFVSFTNFNACAGSEIAFNAVGKNDNTLELALWNFGDGNIAQEFAAKNTYARSGNYVVNLSLTNEYGCMDSLQKTVQIYALPELRFSTLDGCQDSPLKFSDSSIVLNDSITSVLWDLGDGSMTSESNHSHSYIAAGQYVTTITASTTNGCSAKGVAMVEVFPKAVPEIIFNDGCEDNLIQFMQGNDLFLNSASVKWNFEDKYLKNGKAVNHVFENSGKFPVELQITTDMGCVSKEIDTVLVYAKPTALFESNISTGCQFSEVGFLNKSYAENKAVYYWQFGDGHSSMEESPSHVYENPGNYVVNLEIISEFGCENNYTSDDQIKIYPNPVSVFEMSSTQLDLKKSELQVDNNSTGSIGWNWNFGDGRSSNSLEPAHIFADTGYFQVTLEVYNEFGCTDTSMQMVHVEPKTLIYFPNAITLNGDGLNEIFKPIAREMFSNYSLLIFNRWGKKIFESKNMEFGWNGTLNGEVVPQGVYTWLVELQELNNRNRNFSGTVTVLK